MVTVVKFVEPSALSTTHTSKNNDDQKINKYKNKNNNGKRKEKEKGKGKMDERIEMRLKEVLSNSSQSANEISRKLCADSLTGQQRRNYLQQRMTDLGMPTKSPIDPSSASSGGMKKQKQKPRVPMRMAMEMIQSARERAQKVKKSHSMGGDEMVSISCCSTPSQSAGQIVKIMQMNNSSSSSSSKSKSGKDNLVWTSDQHPMKAVFDRKNALQVRARALGLDVGVNDRGMRIKTGRFKDGTLHLSKREISDISAAPTDYRQSHSHSHKKRNKKNGNKKGKTGGGGGKNNSF